MTRDGMWVMAAALAVSLAGTGAGAAEVGRTEKSRADLAQGEKLSPWRILGSVGAGLNLVGGSGYDGEPAGPAFTIGAGASRRWAGWELEGQLSWLYSSLGGTHATGVPVTVRTRAGMAELDARKRLGERWQLGPSLGLAFGTDTDLDPAVGRTRVSWLLGAKGLYELSPRSRTAARLWGQIATDVSISNRQAFFVLAGVQFAFAPREPEPVADQVRVTRAAPKRRLEFVLDPQKVFFATNSAVVRPEVRKVLNEVGEYLGKHPRAWGSAELSGHADSRGRYKYNLMLSQRRSDSVRAALVEAGADATRMSSRSYSFSRPLAKGDGPAVWAVNRRVEIVFLDVEDPEMLSRKLQPLAYQKPRPDSGVPGQKTARINMKKERRG